MQKVQELIGEFPEERKVSIHVPDPQYKDWNEVLSTAMRKMQPLEQIPFLRGEAAGNPFLCCAEYGAGRGAGIPEAWGSGTIPFGGDWK